jgi:hypothetical protein
MTALKDNVSGLSRKSPATVYSESDENWPIVFLDVSTAVLVLRLHKAAALGPPDRVEHPVAHNPAWPLLQLLGQQLIHQLRIRLALRSLHDLADEESNDGLLPPPVLLNLLGVGSDDLINDFF